MPIYVTVSAPKGRDVLCCYFYASRKPYYDALKKHGGKHHTSISYETDPSIDTYTSVFESQEQADAFKADIKLAGWTHQHLMEKFFWS